jgi:predicted aspartyl protease
MIRPLIRLLAFGAGLAPFWSLFPQTALAEGMAECRRLATVKIETLADGRIKIPVTVEDRKLFFLLDTGGTSTTIKWEDARALGLPVRQAVRRLAGVGGSVLNFTVTGEKFSIGDLRVENRPIYVETRPLAGADGTLGPDILRNYDVEIDFIRGSLSLISPDYCAGPDRAGSAVIALDVAQDGHVRLPVKIDGKTIMATLDTGSTISVIGMQAAALLGVYPNSPDLALVHDAGRYRIYTHPFQTLEIGSLSVKNPRIAIASDRFLPGLGSDLVLGIDALRQMHLTIAYVEQRLYLKAEGN